MSKTTIGKFLFNSDKHQFSKRFVSVLILCILFFSIQCQPAFSQKHEFDSDNPQQIELTNENLKDGKLEFDVTFKTKDGIVGKTLSFPSKSSEFNITSPESNGKNISETTFTNTLLLKIVINKEPQNEPVYTINYQINYPKNPSAKAGEMKIKYSGGSAKVSAGSTQTESNKLEKLIEVQTNSIKEQTGSIDALKYTVWASYVVIILMILLFLFLRIRLQEIHPNTRPRKNGSVEKTNNAVAFNESKPGFFNNISGIFSNKPEQENQQEQVETTETKTQPEILQSIKELILEEFDKKSLQLHPETVKSIDSIHTLHSDLWQKLEQLDSKLQAIKPQQQSNIGSDIEEIKGDFSGFRAEINDELHNLKQNFNNNLTGINKNIQEINTKMPDKFSSIVNHQSDSVQKISTEQIEDDTPSIYGKDSQTFDDNDINVDENQIESKSYLPQSSKTNQELEENEIRLANHEPEIKLEVGQILPSDETETSPSPEMPQILNNYQNQSRYYTNEVRNELQKIKNRGAALKNFFLILEKYNSDTKSRQEMILKQWKDDEEAYKSWLENDNPNADEVDVKSVKELRFLQGIVRQIVQTFGEDIMKDNLIETGQAIDNSLKGSFNLFLGSIELTVSFPMENNEYIEKLHQRENEPSDPSLLISKVLSPIIYLEKNTDKVFIKGRVKLK